MNLNKVITRFSAAPSDRDELRRLARALGSELPREQLEVLRRFRAELARVSGGGAGMDGDLFAAGYVSSMLDVTAEYETSVQQSEDAQALEAMVDREGWGEVLQHLNAGSKLPSELADELGEDRSTVTRKLQKLRAAGLARVQAGRTVDGRKKPHRLTAEGRRLTAKLQAGLSPDVVRGIRVAVALFRHLIASNSSITSTLDKVAGEALGQRGHAPEAVRVWASEAENAGLISKVPGAESAPEAEADVRVSNGVPQPVLANGTSRSEALWYGAPLLLRKLARRSSERVPVYVRTTDEGSGPWAHALDRLEPPGRTIVDEDIAAHAIEPPDQRFHLVYDDPDAIRGDILEPIMREFMERAAAKFVVVAPDQDHDIPEGFIELEMDDSLDDEITLTGG
jgi:DNA-binding MarR family transcriptional regulator